MTLSSPDVKSLFPSREKATDLTGYVRGIFTAGWALKQMPSFFALFFVTHTFPSVPPDARYPPSLLKHTEFTGPEWKSNLRGRMSDLNCHTLTELSSPADATHFLGNNRLQVRVEGHFPNCLKVASKSAN